MLTRRTLFKFAATFGLGVLVPRLDQSAHGAIPEAKQGHDPVRDDVRRLDALLKTGGLNGRRRENEHASRMLEEAQRFYEELLCERPEGAMARECLAGQGITPSTVNRFRIGYSPAEPDDLLSRHLTDAGYVIPKLLQRLHVNEDGEQKMVDRYGGGNLLIPVRDRAGHSWGFLKKTLLSRQDSLWAGWTQDTLAVSERRLRRLIFPHPSWPQDLNQHKILVVAETPWEVVVLHNAGIENVVYLFDCATDPVRLRTLFSISHDFVCGFDPKGYRPVTAFRFVERLEREERRLFMMEVPSKGGLIALLQSGGRQAVQDAMTQAIPLPRWMGEECGGDVDQGMAVTAHFADRDPFRFAHAGHPEQIPGAGDSGSNELSQGVQ